MLEPSLDVVGIAVPCRLLMIPKGNLLIEAKRRENKCWGECKCGETAETEMAATPYYILYMMYKIIQYTAAIQNIQYTSPHRPSLRRRALPPGGRQRNPPQRPNISSSNCM